jgi:molecular chaperone GrpE
MSDKQQGHPTAEEIDNNTVELQSESILEEVEEVKEVEEVESVLESEIVSKESELEEKLAESENRYLRLRADFDNLRRRTILEREASEKFRSQSLITDILPTLDSFERALKMDAKSDESKTILQGMEMVYRSLFEALQKEGVEVIETVGQPFDPYLHQAVMQEEDAENPSNIVIEEFQKGYKLKDRVIRPSMVKVSQ